MARPSIAGKGPDGNVALSDRLNVSTHQEVNIFVTTHPPAPAIFSIMHSRKGAPSEQMQTVVSLFLTA